MGEKDTGVAAFGFWVFIGLLTCVTALYIADMNKPKRDPVEVIASVSELPAESEGYSYVVDQNTGVVYLKYQQKYLDI